MSWDGEAGDNVWDNPRNWVGGQLPGPGDDVVLLPGTSVTIYVRSAAQVRGLTMGEGTALNLAGVGVDFSASGPAKLDGVSLSVSEGATLSLPGLTQYSAARMTNSYVAWDCAGAGSAITLPGLANLVGSPPPWMMFVRVWDGGRSTLGGEFGITGGRVTFGASDVNSVLEAPGLRRVSASAFEFDVNAGARVSLPSLGEYLAGDGDGSSVYWYCTGKGTLLELAGLTNFVGSPYPWVTSVRAYTGARVTLNGKFSILEGGVNFTVSGAGTSFEAPELLRVACNDFRFAVGEGARVSLPGLRDWQGGGGSFGWETWSCNGAGSVLELPGLTNLAGAPWPHLSLWSAEAGGRVSLGGDFAVLSGRVRFAASGEGSVLETPGMRRLAPSFYDLAATGGGRLALTGLRDCSGANTYGVQLYWMADGAGSVLEASNLTSVAGSPWPWTTVWLAQGGGRLKLGGEFRVQEGGVSFRAYGTNSVLEAPNLSRLAAEGMDLDVQNGGLLHLPGLREFAATNAFLEDVYWQSSGAGSVIELPGLTNFLGSPFGRSTLVAARQGGRVSLGGEFSVPGGGVIFVAEGTNSLFEAPTLRRLAANQSGVYAQDGGRVSLPGLEEYSGAGIAWDRSHWESSGGASVIQAGGLAKFVGSPSPWPTYLVASGGGRITLGGEFSVSDGELVISADGANSLIEAPTLRRLTPSYLSIDVLNGGRVSLPGLLEFSGANCRRSGLGWTATGTGSRIEMPGLSQFLAPQNPSALFIAARQGGQIVLSSIPAITSGTVDVLAEGADSAIDLRSVNGFDPVGGSGSLRVVGAGSILLPSLFTLHGAASLENVGAWGLPAVSAASYQGEVLCATPGLSAVVEARSAGDTNAPWKRFGRVPMTTNQVALRSYFRVPPGTELRVRELLADPPELELHPAPAGKVRLTLFGLPGTAYRLHATPFIAPNPVWSDAGRVALTHSFEQIDFALSLADMEFLRAARE